MNFNGIIKGAGSTLSKVGLQIQKHSPEILVTVGVIGTVASTVMACKATTKVSVILEETKEKVDQVHTVLESDEYTEEEYSVEDSKKDLAIIYAQSAVKFAKLYGPSILLGAASISCILASHRILTKRNVALAAAYAGLDKGFKNYRKNVVERFGEAVDRELKYNIKAQKITDIEVDGHPSGVGYSYINISKSSYITSIFAANH